MSQSSDAMKLAASSGMTLKEAWAQIKGDSGADETTSSPGPARGEKTVARLRAQEEAW